jgi:hypothetical protein
MNACIMNGQIHLDRVLAERCQSLAAKAGYPSRLVAMRFGGGGTRTLLSWSKPGYGPPR